MVTQILTRQTFVRWLAPTLTVLALPLFGGVVSGQRTVRADRAPVRLPSFTVAPVLQPSTEAPLAALVTFQTDVPTRCSLLIDNGVQRTLIPDAEPLYKQDHHVMVLGVFPDTTNLVRVIVHAANGLVVPSLPMTFQTPPLPADFPPIEVLRADPLRAEPGYTTIGPSWRYSNGDPGRGRYAVILDELGRVVWYMEGPGPKERMRNGNYVMSQGRGTQAEIDMLGNTVHLWYAAGLDGGAGAPEGAILVDVDSIHHDIREMPAGADSDLLFLGTELRPYANYPLDESNLSQTVPSADVVGDTVVEILKDGTIVRQKSLLDILDPYRIGWGNTSQFGPYEGETRDWSHSNSVFFDESDDTYIVSSRHLDCVTKFKRSTPGSGSPDDLVWILGNHEGWNAPWSSKLLTPLPWRTRHIDGAQLERFEWQYHQHSAYLNHLGNLVLYDNGNYRVTPPDQAPPEDTWYSRAVEYRIDPLAMTVRQVWSIGGRFDPQPYRLGYSSAQSSAVELGTTHNVLVDSARERDFVNDIYFTHVREVTRTREAETLFEFTIREPDLSKNWAAGEAMRVTGLYPHH